MRNREELERDFERWNTNAVPYQAQTNALLLQIACQLADLNHFLSVFVDPVKHIVRMEDIERAKVYSTHLGGKLREGEEAKGGGK